MYTMFVEITISNHCASKSKNLPKIYGNFFLLAFQSISKGNGKSVKQLYGFEYTMVLQLSHFVPI